MFLEWNLSSMDNRTLKKMIVDDLVNQLIFKLKTPEGREEFFLELSKLNQGIPNLQDKHTPFSLIRKLVNKTNLKDKNILVLFNIEFLEVLLQENNIDSSSITFIADNELEYLTASKIYKVKAYQLYQYELIYIKNFIEGLKMKFDLTFSNPPYTQNIDLKILNEIMPFTKEAVIVHPSSYILKDGGDNCLYKEFNNNIKNKVLSIEFIDPWTAFYDIDAKKGVLNPTPCIIMHYNNAYNGKIDVSYSFKKFFNIDDNNYNVSSVDEITIYGSKYKSLVLPFKENIEEYCLKNGSLIKIKQNKIIYDDCKFYCQLPQISGQVNRSRVFKSFYEHTFFTMIPQNDDTSVEFENNVPKPSKKNNFVFDTQIEHDNFKNYLKTDFARFCLSLKKFSKNLQTDSFELIPLMEFKRSWNDEELYAHFNISKDMMNYIQEFIPDFYGLRK